MPKIVKKGGGLAKRRNSLLDSDPSSISDSNINMEEGDSKSGGISNNNELLDPEAKAFY